MKLFLELILIYFKIISSKVFRVHVFVYVFPMVCMCLLLEAYTLFSQGCSSDEETGTLSIFPYVFTLLLFDINWPVFKCVFVFSFKKYFIYLFLERGKGREKERERDINV